MQKRGTTFNTAPEEKMNLSPTSNWRTLVTAKTRTRRQSPNETQKTVTNILAKTAPPLPITLPNLLVHQQHNQSVISIEPQLSPRSFSRILRTDRILTKEKYGLTKNATTLLMESLDKAKRKRVQEQERRFLMEEKQNETSEPSEPSDSLMEGVLAEVEEEDESKSPLSASQSSLNSSKRQRSFFVEPISQPVEESKENLNSRFSGSLPVKLSSINPTFTSTAPSLPISKPSIASTDYTIPPPDPSQLYQPTLSTFDQLPLELFDCDEGDLTPQQWVQLGQTKYAEEGGTPAKALYYQNGEWIWTQCRVTAYNESTGDFTIVFPSPPVTKTTKRLSLLFDDEDSNKFHTRLTLCKQLRDECLSWRRYASFIESQSTTLFSPIQQAVLQGIIGKLMMTSEALVLRRQPSVERLLVEVKEEYNRAMKSAIIDYKRTITEEAEKMKHLRLPALVKPRLPPYLAVIPTPPHLYPFNSLLQFLSNFHYTHHTEAVNVMLSLHRSYDSLCSLSFFDLHEDYSSPILSLIDWVNRQEQQFISVRERLQNDWRALLINLIRDNLNNVFKLFVNDPAEFEKSELKRFLKMSGLMLRDQLIELVGRSIKEFSMKMKLYEGSIKSKLENNSNENAVPVDILEGYLEDIPKIPNIRPLFLFKLTLEGREVSYLPPLSALQPQLLGLLTLPAKLSSITHIDTDVVPLLGLSDIPLLENNNGDNNNNPLHELCINTNNQINLLIEESILQPIELLNRYSTINNTLQENNNDSFIKDWFSYTGDTEVAADTEDMELTLHNRTSKHSLEETHRELLRYHSIIQNINLLSPSIVTLQLIQVDTSLIKDQLITISKNYINTLLQGLNSCIQKENTELKLLYERICQKLNTKSNNVYEMASLKKYVENIEINIIPSLQIRIQKIQVQLDLLIQFQYCINRADYQLCYVTLKYPSELLSLIEKTKITITNDTTNFQLTLQQEQNNLSIEIEQYNKECDLFVDMGYGPTATMEQYAAKVEALAEKLDRAELLVESFNKRDNLFGELSIEYTELVDLRARFTPYFELWSTTSLFNSSYSVWMTGPFNELDATVISRDVNGWIKLMFKLEKIFLQEDLQKPMKVAIEMKNQLIEFKNHLPLIQWLRSPGLRPRHWEKLSALLSPTTGKHVNLSADGDLTLSQLLSLNLHVHATAIEEICSAAQKEYGLEVSLDKMAKEWKNLNFELEAYKETGTYVLSSADDILTLLDDQLQKTQSIKGSPYIKFFEHRTKKWESRLQLISSIMEEWLICQKTYQYLLPIFSSDDIMRQMPVEGRRFGVVDTYWRKTLEQAKRVGNIMDFVSETEGVLKTFQESNKMLDLIGKHLNEYLETKRLAFPRFYFLSNDELLSILSQTKNANAVQPHLSKCFDAMNSLVFTDSQVITGMTSAEGELVPYESSIDPNEGAKKGNVEIWLKDVETQMKETLKILMTRGVKSYSESDKRGDWVLSQTGQIVLAVTSIYWTRGVEEAIRKGTKEALSEFLSLLNSQLLELVALVRRTDLTNLQRMTLGSLTVLDVHARDVVSKMIEVGVKTEDDFEWLSQMRYYYAADPSVNLTPKAGALPAGLVSIRMIHTSLPYGYEYLGNTTRLVITPLTDRCYRTLMSAMALHLGGAPEGPAGTGKTETVKDLAKAVAQMCIVFNCSDALNYRSMAKFFKGLCCSGAWSCFDEFNRIDLEVLSVIAQQVSSIQRAISDKKFTFTFEGQNIPLIHSCAVFITMNPGYAGRSELPDNLKALFRSVAMMIPDYALIAEIVLYSYGYTYARVLARKLVACLRLCSEQLSSQDHYDFGMRNVKSILSAAGQLKKECPNENEEWLCVRAISDCNKPKFLQADIPLFNGIVKDLFPSVEFKLIERQQLVQQIESTLLRQNHIPVPAFVGKCIELYETIQVRHGMMLVGAAFSGKTNNIRTLSASLTALSKENSSNFSAVDVAFINPKSVTVEELYGCDNSVGEWQDGILPIIMRTAVTAQSDDHHWKWIVFDGPVDAVWIENMNTVLDDNKKLCLASGEQIKVPNHMSLLFEVDNLAQASPATVSRCGMVYMQWENIGSQALIDSWLASAPADLSAPLLSELRKLMLWLIPPLLSFVGKATVPIVPTSEMALVANFIKIMNSLLGSQDYNLKAKAKAEEEEKKLQNENDASLEDSNSPTFRLNDTHETDNADLIELKIHQLESQVLFALVWSLGANADAAGRTSFHEFLTLIISGKGEDNDHGISIPAEYVHKKIKLLLPSPDEDEGASDEAEESDETRTLYDYFYNAETNSWSYWMNKQSSFAIPPHSRYHEIIVPTIDTIRSDYLVDALLTQGYHVLLAGSTGTGKSITASSKLLQGMDRAVYIPLLLSFSARTSANGTQELIDSKLERRRVGIMGPPASKKMVFFVDDLNMPARDTYGAQPPIELLRQWMDYGGWFDKKAKTFKQIVDVQFIAAMGTGGGRQSITSRYTRHLVNVCMNAYSSSSLKRIFTTLMKWHFTSYAPAIQDMTKSLVDATVGAYTTLTQELLPTPAKSHYTFNLRDVSKVFAGITQVDSESLTDPLQLIRIWSHECTRVFCDRLVEKSDMTWFESLINLHIKDTFQMTVEQVFPPSAVIETPAEKIEQGGLSPSAVVPVAPSKAVALRRQIFADFSNPRASTKKYSEIHDVAALTTVVENYLIDYNNLEKNAMNLVLFTESIDHIARISRIIRQPYGNALLVGVGGSGRQSLTKLAAFIADYECFSIEITKNYSTNEWREDLRSVMKKAGLNNKPLVFLLTDNQISQESFLEDMNNILNTGEVPNLFPADELTAVIEVVLPDARKAGKAENNASVYQFFIDRCKLNIHVVLCLSPLHPSFRSRLRSFPSLVNCTSIDWFHPWPTEALEQVAAFFLKEVDLDPAVKEGVVAVCVDMQERVQVLSQEYYTSLHRYNYVTPTSYLELIKLFRSLFESTRSEIQSQLIKYQTGLTKLMETEKQVKSMQIQLNALQPELIQSSKETEELIATIATRSQQVAVTRATVGEEEKECNMQAEKASAIKKDCEDQLNEALPILQTAMNALKVLKKSSLDELKAMKVPTPAVILTIEALCIMMNVAPKKIGQVGSKHDDYWEPAKKKLLSDPQLFMKLQTYDKDNIPQEIIDKVRPYCRNPDFSAAKVAKASLAAEGFCKWVLALESYDRVAKVVEPKRKALAEAEETLGIASAQLAAKKQQLAEVEALLLDLNTQFELVNKKKQSLEFQVKECSQRLDRAEKLLGGLSNEKVRWEERIKQLISDLENVVGNILISSGVIAYLGVFTSTFRDSCISNWLSLLKAKNIPSDDKFNLARVLGDPMLIRQWGIWQLPKDNFSIENAIILTKSMRWGLIIDPQEQANRWIKKMEETGNGLKVIKQTDENFIKVLNTSIQLGLPVLIEHIQENLDPVLEPLLLRQTFKQGNQLMMKFANEILAYHEDFRLYLTSKHPNPHYSPDICTRVTLINFMITPEGLEDQILAAVVTCEEPELEAERSEIIVKNAENQRQLNLIENKILEKLNESTGMILDDEELINTLQKSKQAAKLIEKRVAAALKTEENINKTRMAYTGVAFSSSNLFFCISDLANLDPMYQYSLNWFNLLFLKSIKEAEKSLDVHIRTGNIERQFLRLLYLNVCRSLFEKDKLLFSFMLTLRVLQGKSQVTKEEIRFFLSGGDITSVNLLTLHNPCIWSEDMVDEELEGEKEADDAEEEEEEEEDDHGSSADKDNKLSGPGHKAAAKEIDLDASGHWLTNTQWARLLQLSAFAGFTGLCDHISKNQRKWKALYDTTDLIKQTFPSRFDQLPLFQKLMIVRCLRADKLVMSVRSVVAGVLGKEFISPPPFDLHGAYSDSETTTPLIFILSPGVDIASEVLKLAIELGMNSNERLTSISLGQGQGPLAEAAIREAMDKGSWVLLQNCHLQPSFLPTLQKIIDDINPTTTNSEFRLWLTSLPTKAFPVSILQNGVKITNEPPKGVKANLFNIYRSVDEGSTVGAATGSDNNQAVTSVRAGGMEQFNSERRKEEYKRLYFGLALFHAIVQERRKFGSIGWNRYYEFTDSDLRISQTQLLQLIASAPGALPYIAFHYLTGQLNYGGRVTDEWDRRLLVALLEDTVSSRMIGEDVKIKGYGALTLPSSGSDMSEYKHWISELPINDDSELFGLHANVSITCALKEANEMFATLLSLQPTSSGIGGISREEKIAQLATELFSSLPAPFDLETAAERYPVVYSESMNTVLQQELIRYNKLLITVKTSLIEVGKALAGTVVMSTELEATANSMYDGYVPASWQRVSYPSLKPLAAWIFDFKRRLQFYSDWLKDGCPSVYWISGFFFTQSFLTGCMQNYARKHKIPIDECGFEFKVMNDMTPPVNGYTQGDLRQIAPPAEGVYIYGLYLEGARWDYETQILAESHRRQLYCDMPVIHLIPTPIKDIDKTKSNYLCPVYKTSARAGILSTTGHSTNFVLSINLPKGNIEERHWIKRSVALFTQLDS